jgi:hypothetical protein
MDRAVATMPQRGQEWRDRDCLQASALSNLAASCPILLNHCAITAEMPLILGRTVPMSPHCASNLLPPCYHYVGAALLYTYARQQAIVLYRMTPAFYSVTQYRQ